jgi:hypothetical protein
MSFAHFARAGVNFGWYRWQSNHRMLAVGIQPRNWRLGPFRSPYVRGWAFGPFVVTSVDVSRV